MFPKYDIAKLFRIGGTNPRGPQSMGVVECSDHYLLGQHSLTV